MIQRVFSYSLTSIEKKITAMFFAFGISILFGQPIQFWIACGGKSTGDLLILFKIQFIGVGNDERLFSVSTLFNTNHLFLCVRILFQWSLVEIGSLGRLVMYFLHNFLQSFYSYLFFGKFLAQRW